MSLTEIKHLPKLSQDSGSTIAFATIDQHSVLLVVEAHRDFLSAPRHFIPLKVSTEHDFIFSTNGSFLSDKQWQSLDKLAYGFYQVSPSLMDLSENQTHWLCYTPERIVEFSAVQIDVLQTLYHKSDAFDAMSQFLSAYT